jgi:hypothetical protein
MFQGDKRRLFNSEMHKDTWIDRYHSNNDELGESSVANADWP